jgi:hypothetical protein
MSVRHRIELHSESLGPAAGFDNPLGATISPDGSKLYVISGSPSVSVLRVIQLTEGTFIVGAGITGDMSLTRITSISGLDCEE